jgi:biopolymer transport protein ExbD
MLARSGALACRIATLTLSPMKINLETAADDAQIQIVPLIDVIFCILTFFILAALQLTRQQGINIDLPKASTGAVQMRQMLVVSIDASGQTFIDKNPIDRTQLFTLLKEYRDKNPEGLLVLNASQNAFYNDVIQVLDTLRSVGGDKVALATLPSPTINPGTNPTGQPGMPGQPGIVFPNNGTPGLPNVPGVTNPLLSPGTNPLAPNAPLPPSSYPGVLPNQSSPTTVPGTVNPSTANPGTVNPSTTNPTGTANPSSSGSSDATGTLNGDDGLINPAVLGPDGGNAPNSSGTVPTNP